MTAPRHVLLVPDGNRRYGKKHGLTPRECYRLATAKIGEIARWMLQEEGVEQFTVYGLSYENMMKRDPEETGAIESAWIDELRAWLGCGPFHESGVRIRIKGETAPLSQEFRGAIAAVEKGTEGRTGKKLDLLLGYSGQRELVDASRKWQGGGAGYSDFREALDVSEPIDLMIRTGDAIRLSNCPLYALGYAELVFLDKLFPELDRADIRNAIEEYGRRKRNFGR